MPEYWDKVKGLYINYHTNVGLLIIDVEVKYNQFPTQILNEIRSFTTHVSRIANEGATFSQEEVEEQIRRAGRHIVRMQLDLLKVLTIWYFDEFNGRFKEEYKGVPIDDIIFAGIRFDTYYFQKLTKATNLVKQAKRIELVGPAEVAIPVYEKAMVEFQELELFIIENKPILDETKARKQEKTDKEIQDRKDERKSDKMESFIRGIFTSLIAAALFAAFFEEPLFAIMIAIMVAIVYMVFKL